MKHNVGTSRGVDLGGPTRPNGIGIFGEDAIANRSAGTLKMNTTAKVNRRRLISIECAIGDVESIDGGAKESTYATA